MGRRLGKKRGRVSVATIPFRAERSPADRRATDLLIKAQVVAVEVEDPYALEPGDKIVAFRSLRDDPLARLHCRQMIDDAQYSAGKDYRRDLEMIEIGGARAIDPTKEAVDGGRHVERDSDAYGKAHKRLAEASKVMGLFHESVVRAVLAGNLFPAQVAVLWGYTSDRDQDYYARSFRTGLELLAGFYGYAPLQKR
jgi:hypothetical protein